LVAEESQMETVVALVAVALAQLVQIGMALLILAAAEMVCNIRLVVPLLTTAVVVAVVHGQLKVAQVG
jgi:hypothetical protein